MSKEKNETITDFYFDFPSSTAILGSSNAGKTKFLERLLTRLDEVTSNYLPVSRLIICYNTHQTEYDTISEHFQKQFPGIKIETYTNYPAEFSDPNFFDAPPGTMTVLILDDISDLVTSSFENILRKIVHHKNLCLFFLSQDSSGDSPIIKKALRSINYLVIMKSSQPGIFLSDLNKKYLPGHKNFLLNCFEIATRKKSPFFPYLILCPNSENNKIRDGVFKEELSYIYRLPQ